MGRPETRGDWMRYALGINLPPGVDGLPRDSLTLTSLTHSRPRSLTPLAPSLSLSLAHSHARSRTPPLAHSLLRSLTHSLLRSRTPSRSPSLCTRPQACTRARRPRAAYTRAVRRTHMSYPSTFGLLASVCNGLARAVSYVSRPSGGACCARRLKLRLFPLVMTSDRTIPALRSLLFAR